MAKNLREGYRVRMTKAGLQKGLGVRGRKDKCHGVVVKLIPPLAVKVLRDGTKTPYIYHHKFWRHLYGPTEEQQ